MNTVSAIPRGSAPVGAPSLRRRIVNRLAQIMVQYLLFGILLLASAGTRSWWNAWLFLVLAVVVVMANAAYVLPRNPEVIAERGRRHSGTRTFDTIVLTGYTLCYLALFVVAGLDERWSWAQLAWGWALVGAVVLCAADVPVAGAMAVNRNLEPTVRIQSDRGHEVATGGPYRIVRHPMYLAMLLQLPATALILGSAWALVPAGAAAVAIVVRTALEDRALRRDLTGYSQYAEHTRYRLVPGVW